MSNLTITAGSRSIRLRTDRINDEVIQNRVTELAAEPPEHLTVECPSLDKSPIDQHAGVWRLFNAILMVVPVARLIINGREYDDALHAAVARLATAPRKHLETRLQSAIHAAALLGSEVSRRLAAKRICDALKTIGTPERRDWIIRQVEQVRQPASAEVLGPNPTLLAEDFLQYLTDGSSPSSDRFLHYFQGDFYRYHNGSWHRSTTDQFVPITTRFLQDSSSVDKVTIRLVNDVLANVKALALVAAGDEALPFYIDDYGPRATPRRRNLIVLMNGMVDLDQVACGGAAELLPFDSKWFSTVKLPFEFNPDAKCLRFCQFLQQVLATAPGARAAETGDQRIRVLQEFFGYCLLSDARFQKFLIMFGEGANGKSVIQHLLAAMLGAANVSHVGLEQLHGFGLQAILGKTANVCGDLNEMDAVAEGVLKRLTGEDNITIDRKYQVPIVMAPTIKLVFNTNSLPLFRDRSRGIWRRLIAMPFFTVVAEENQNKQLGRDLEAELPGILNWSIRGLKRLLRQGGFTSCDVCRAAVEQHRFDCDPLEQFLDECVDFDARVEVTAPVLYQAYREWCEKAGRKPLSSNHFSGRVNKLSGVTKGRRPQPTHATGQRDYFFRGLGLAGQSPRIPGDPSPRSTARQPGRRRHRNQRN